MKKSLVQTLVNYLTENDIPELAEVKAEAEAELAKDAARKDATAKGYEAAHDAIVGNLDATPVTCTELYDAIVDELPDGFTKNKVQYALTHLWQDEIVVIAGKPNTYRRA